MLGVHRKICYFRVWNAAGSMASVDFRGDITASRNEVG